MDAAGVSSARWHRCLPGIGAICATGILRSPAGPGAQLAFVRQQTQGPTRRKDSLLHTQKKYRAQRFRDT